MRNEDITLQVPESKDDCSKILCNQCYLIAEYLLNDKTFTCHCPQKSWKFWRNVG